jgi:hypothetical protein
MTVNLERQVLADKFLRDGAKLTFDVAHEHPGVIGGTIAALMLWVLRNPIIGWLDALLGPRR